MNQKKAEITRELKRALVILALAGVLFGFDKALYANGASQQLQSGTRIPATPPKYSYIWTCALIYGFCFMSRNASTYAYWRYVIASTNM